MPVVKLTQDFIATKLVCPEGKSKIEYCCDIVKGFLVECRATSPNAGTYYLRHRNELDTTAYVRLGRTADVALVDARKSAKTLKAEIALGAYPKGAGTVIAAVPKFSTFMETTYFDHIRSRKRSWASDVSLYKNYLKADFGHLALDQITRQQVQLMHTKLRTEKKLAYATADHGLKLIRQALNIAISWGLCTVNPAAKVPLYGVDNKVEHYLDEAELARLLTVLRDPSSPRSVCQIALFLLSTGARLNEALTATWSQIDKQTRVWRVEAKFSKAGKIRAIPLNDSALEIINQLDTKGEFEHLFVNRQTGKPYTTIMKVWSRLRAKAGLPFLRIHDLRHMYASFLVNSGRTLYEVQACLGHSDPKVTQRYAHLSTQSLQAAANSASVMIRGAMPVAIPMDLPLLVDLASAREMAISEPVEMAVAA